jgi:type IV pilus assembly protein PilM
VVIDVEAFALHNAFSYNYPNAGNGMVVLVNIGNETTNVNLIADGAPILIRDIPFGTRRLREALQRERGLTMEQAEGVLQGRGDAAQLRAIVDERVDELAIGIERAAAFISAQTGGSGIARAFVTGGGAVVKGMIDSLGARLGVRTELANPLQRVAVRPEVMQAVPIDSLAPLLMLPVGLALRKV